MGRRALWLLWFAFLFGCGVNITPKQLDEPCTRTAQCEVGLVCQAGVCQPMGDAGVGGSGGAGGVGGAGGGS
ncbi:MAG: hypothetical protein JSV06_05085 [Myxococcales bacterium]|nr:MAG: hypothetical protein JSV06_05085 [Myxococcales bacterium]